MWLQALTSILSAFSSLLDWLKQKTQRELGKLEVENKSLKDEVIILKKAEEAREAADTVIQSTPESDSLPDDGYRRD